MRKYLSIAALLAAGAAFANAASVTYGEEGTENTVSAGDQNIYTLSGENPYKSVKISSAVGDPTVNVLIGTWDGEEGTVDGMSVDSSSSNPVNITLRNGTLSGKIDTSGSTGAVYIDLQMGSSTEDEGVSFTTRIAAGTSFVLSSTTTLAFNDMSSGTGVLVWDLSADDVANRNVLISGKEGTAGEKGTVEFSENVTIVLNFESEAALDAVVNNNASFQLFGEGVRAEGLSNASWTVQVAGEETGRTLSVNEKGVATVVPEPSAFGLLAGLGALALVASRRRRTKRA